MVARYSGITGWHIDTCIFHNLLPYVLVFFNSNLLKLSKSYYFFFNVITTICGTTERYMMVHTHKDKTPHMTWYLSQKYFQKIRHKGCYWSDCHNTEGARNKETRSFNTQKTLLAKGVYNERRNTQNDIYT